MTMRRVLHGSVSAIAVALAATLAWWSFRCAQHRYHWREAQRALDAHDIDVARRHLTECFGWPGDPIATHLLVARAARLAGDYDAAEEHLAICEGQPDLHDPNMARERALLQVQQGDFRGHLEFLQRAAKDRDPPSEVLEAMAHGLEATLFFNEAAACLQRLLVQEPDHPRAHMLAGSILLRKRYAEPARHEFEAAVHALPDACTPRLRLAECLLELGEVRAATAHLEAMRVEALRGHDSEVRALALAEARAAVYRTHFADATKSLHRLLNTRPDDVEALITLGQLEFRQGEPRDALPWLERAVRIHPDKPDAWESLSRCYAALGEADRERHCREEFARASRDLGEVTRLIVSAMQERVNDLNVRIELAERYERLHETAKAIQWRMCVLHLDPSHVPTHRALTRLFEQSGQPHRAARHRTLAEKGSP